jgi:hypothetical protein
LLSRTGNGRNPRLNQTDRYPNPAIPKSNPASSKKKMTRPPN